MARRGAKSPKGPAIDPIPVAVKAITSRGDVATLVDIAGVLERIGQYPGFNDLRRALFDLVDAGALVASIEGRVIAFRPVEAA